MDSVLMLKDGDAGRLECSVMSREVSNVRGLVGQNSRLDDFRSTRFATYCFPHTLLQRQTPTNLGWSIFASTT